MEVIRRNYRDQLATLVVSAEDNSEGELELF